MNANHLYRKTFLLTILVILFTSIVFAQPLPEPGDGGNPDGNPVPITGIEYLIAAGAAFGAKKIYDKRKGNSQ